MEHGDDGLKYRACSIPNLYGPVVAGLAINPANTARDAVAAFAGSRSETRCDRITSGTICTRHDREQSDVNAKYNNELGNMKQN